MTNDHHECCLRCQSRRIIIGKVINSNGFSHGFFRCFRPVGFWPSLAYKLALGRMILIPLPSESFLCLDCGTAWTKVDPQLAEAVLRDRANPTQKQSLGLVEKPTSIDDELA